MNKPPVPVICAANSKYNMPLCVMLSSLADNFDPKRDLFIYIISNDATSRDKDNVRESIRRVRPKLDHIEIHWLSVESSLMEKLPDLSHSHLSRDAYARLFAPYLLPESCERAIYLDCDMVILGDVSKLYDATVDSPALIHAVPCLFSPTVSSHEGVFDYAERGIPPETRCFNSGVMAINLKQWRERNLTPPLIDYLVQGGDRVHAADQGAMNAFLYRDWVPLDLRWNQTGVVTSDGGWTSSGYTREEWLRMKNDPYVVHYTGPLKPWTEGRPLAPRRIYFFQYLQKTVYRSTVPRYPYLEGLLGFHAYYILWKLIGKYYRMLAGTLRLAGDMIGKSPKKI